jgi:hypothetical protein
VDTWKTLNEKRVEKGVEPIDLANVKNPADLPMNVQAVQLWQSQQQGMGGGSPFGMGDEDFEDEDEETGEDAETGGENTDGDAGPDDKNSGSGSDGWDEIEAQHGTGEVKKSLGGTVRIVI